MTATARVVPHAGTQWVYEPFVEPDPEQMTRVRDLFVRLRFTEAEICAIAGMSSIYELESWRTRTKVLADNADAQSLLVKLLVDGVPIPWRDARSTLAESDLELLCGLGLLQTSLLDSQDCVATVAIYPIGGLWIVSDKHSHIEAVAEGIPGDIVYSALTAETHRFIDLMPRVKCGDYLELCSGTGIAALLAAHEFAERACAVDITHRSTRFARYNIALNALENAEAMVGDVYTPVSGRTFDMITAHPPYVPSVETTMVYRDGGEDGEQITRRIIEGLAEHLRPGGQFFCEGMMTDREGAPLEDRVRQMLGPRASEFDIVLGQMEAIDVEELIGRVAQAQGWSAESVEQWRAKLGALRIDRFVNVGLLIHRRRAPGNVVTHRRVVSGETTGEHYQRFLRWAVSVSKLADPLASLLDARPRRAAGVELRSRSVCDDSGWRVAEASIVTRTPFATEVKCPMWFATLLAKCDGRTTTREHLRHLRDVGVIPSSASDGEFARLVGQLADGGFVELNENLFQSLDDERLS